MHTELTVTLPYEWSRAREVREKVQEALSELAAETLEVTEIAGAEVVASELVENALKYGTCVSAQPEVVFHLCYDGTLLRIQVTQGVRSNDALTALQACLTSLAGDASPEDLYLARLEAIATGSREGGLGLYRVAYEGGYHLAHHLERNVLTVTAERRLEAAS